MINLGKRLCAQRAQVACSAAWALTLALLAGALAVAQSPASKPLAVSPNPCAPGRAPFESETRELHAKAIDLQAPESSIAELPLLDSARLRELLHLVGYDKLDLQAEGAAPDQQIKDGVPISDLGARGEQLVLLPRRQRRVSIRKR